MPSELKILYLANRPARNTQASTVTEYLDALKKYSRHDVYEISMLHDFPERINLDRFDVVITHYSLSLGSLIHHYLGSNLIYQLKHYSGLKVAFLQDEYREIQTYWKNLNDLGIDVLFSCVPQDEIHKVYPVQKVLKLQVVNVLTGYVPEALVSQKVLQIAQRSIDVGYRTRKPPYWLGRLGYEKWFIAEEFNRLAVNSGLKLDLSTREGERLYGKSWTDFVASCRAVIGVESGASIIDFDGNLERRVDDYVTKNPQVSFDEVHELFLKPFEGSLRLNQISPRCFEAAALRTPMILFEGEYSGILKPNRHFIPLRKDFSNFNDILRDLRDYDKLQEIADLTFSEIAMNPKWSYKAFIEVVDKIVEDAVVSRGTQLAHTMYPIDDFRKDLVLSGNYFLRRQLAMVMQRLFLGFPSTRKMVFGIWQLLPYSFQKIIRPLARILSK